MESSGISAEGESARYMVARWLSKRGDCGRRLVEPPGPTWVHSPSGMEVSAGTGQPGSLHPAQWH
eukprot:810381-Amphidinium_carterae.1